MNSTETKKTPRIYITKSDGILVRDLNRRVQDLEADIKRETNKKERARLEDEQASIKLVLRLFNSQKVGILPREERS